MNGHLNENGQWVVDDGDCLYDIAAQESVYNDGSRWKEIAEKNGIDTEYPIVYVGDILDIPNLSSTQGGN